MGSETCGSLCLVAVTSTPDPKNGTCIRTYLKYTVDAPFFFSIVGIKGLPGYFSTWGDMCNMRLALRDEEPTGFSRIYSDNMF